MRLATATRADSYVATEAIVLYRPERGHSARGFATVHPVTMEGERPVIQEGTVLDTSQMTDLMMRLIPERRLQFVEARVLAANEQDVVWWTPPAKRAVWFNTSGEDGIGSATGATWHPGLVFAAGEHGWFVWAVKGGARPEANTELHQAPYYNVNYEGRICEGNVVLPERAAPEYLDEYEDAFFRSRFTHPNVHVKRQLTRYRGGAAALWSHLLKGKGRKFPEWTLVPKRATLGRMIEQLGSSGVGR